MPGSGDVLLSPGPLLAQRLRRPGTQIPVPGAGELVPVAHPACPHVDQDLIRPEPRSPGKLQKLHGAAEPAHASSPSPLASSGEFQLARYPAAIQSRKGWTLAAG